MDIIFGVSNRFLICGDETFGKTRQTKAANFSFEFFFYRRSSARQFQPRQQRAALKCFYGAGTNCSKVVPNCMCVHVVVFLKEGPPPPPPASHCMCAFGKPGYSSSVATRGVGSKEEERCRWGGWWENIGPRSQITRQSHTWFHVRRRQNFKEEPL